MAAARPRSFIHRGVARGRAAPEICTFPQGPPAAFTSFAEPIAFKRDKDRGGALLGSSPSADFEPAERAAGAAASGEAGATWRYAIGRVPSGDSQPIQLLEVPRVLALRQRPKRRRQSTDGDGVQDFGTKRRLLVEQFGSKKSARKLRMDAANRFNAGQAESVVSAVAVGTRAPVARGAEDGDPGPAAAKDPLEELRAQSLPPFNAETKDVEEVYPRRSLLGEDAWEAVPHKAVMELARDPTALDEAQLPKFIVNRLRNLPSGEKESSLRNLARVLGYLSYLLQFAALPRGAKAFLAERTGCPPQLADAILSRFAEQHEGRWIVPGPLQNKAVLHVCVLALTACNFVLKAEQLALLAEDLTMPVSKLLLFLREVGARSSGREAEREVRLTVPLSLPPIRRGPR